ncbi:hypothetical protein [Streptomyces sp. NPDC051173]|uniref:hypothetical protein n=1 Tax=Streptomyces sp. NPDC051173 TaxID=3155164 RepID=UPI00344D98A8
MATRPDKAARLRLAALITARRVELGMHKIGVARAAELTITTYSKLEDGDSVRDVTYGKIEPVLSWAPGTCRSVLEGAAPTVVEPAPAAGAYYSPVNPGDLERDVEQAVTNAAIAVTEMAAPEIRKLKQRVVEELRRSGRRSGSAATEGREG